MNLPLISQKYNLNSEDSSGNDDVPGGEYKIELADSTDLSSTASEETNDTESENSENEVEDNPKSSVKRQAPSQLHLLDVRNVFPGNLAHGGKLQVSWLSH